MTTNQPARPLPTISPRMRPFFDAAREERLMLQRCRACSRYQFPAVEFCPECLAAELEWVDASGKAEVFSYVVIHQSYDPYFSQRVPYAVVEVKLEEGPLMTSSVIDCDPSEIEIGMPLSVVFERLNDTIALPAFRTTARF